MYMVLSTLLYYYIDGKYGNCDSTGIRTLEDPIDERESIDPTDSIPPMDPSLLAKAGVNIEPAFSLISDGETTPLDHVIVRDSSTSTESLRAITCISLPKTGWRSGNRLGDRGETGDG